MISKKQNIVFSLLFSAIFLLIFSSSYSQKTLRVGYINMDYILENLDDYKLANQEYSLKLDKWRREIEKKNNDLDVRFKELEIKRPLITTTIYEEFKLN